MFKYLCRVKIMYTVHSAHCTHVQRYSKWTLCALWYVPCAGLFFLQLERQGEDNEYESKNSVDNE